MDEEPTLCKHCQKIDVWLNFEGYEYVCYSCGSVHSVAIGNSSHEFFKDHYNWSVGNHYQAKFHFNERMSQWRSEEPLIPDPDIKAILESCKNYELQGRIVEGKRDIQRVLRSLGKKYSKKYLEKWLTILKCFKKQVFYEKPDNWLIDCLRSNFNRILGPFENTKPKNRKHLPNYNYIIRQLLYIIDPAYEIKYKFCFPLLQSKKKLLVLDKIWQPVCAYNGWDYRCMSELID